MKVVCLGDSLTYGYGVPRKDCWASLTAARTGHTLVTRGVNGDTTGGMLARFGRDVLEERPQRVLLMGGANDIIYGGSDAPARRNLMAMVRPAEAAVIRPMVGLADFCMTPGVKRVDFPVPALLPPAGARRYLDGLHPDREGHRLMAEAACAALPAPRI